MRYRLESAHTWPGDVYLEEGTEVGDDTKYPLYDGFVPSSAMVPLDDAARNEIDKYRSIKGEHWSNRPENNLPIRGDMHPVHRSPQADNQPIIPPPLEHLTHPNTMRPGEPERLPPHIVEALETQNEENRQEAEKRRAEQDKIEAMKANNAADKRAQSTPGPIGVTASTPTGPKPPQSPAVDRKPEPPKPASEQVPRNTGSLVPESPDGKRQEPKDEKKK